VIDPKQLAQEIGIEELCATANDYFKSLADPTPWMIKPFSSLVEAPELLQNIGFLFAGLHLGKTMTVLEFGAGSCWVSRMLNQLQCQTISCDVSEAALEIGKRLFREQPPLGEVLFQPRFLHFDGKHIELPDETVDRIICNDAFHHVPNQREVLSELARVLKSGGVAGFSEPGPRHSRHPQSQMEMKNYRVLENDIDLSAIFDLARDAGFSSLSCRLLSNMALTLDQYTVLLNDPLSQPPAANDNMRLEQTIMANVRHTMADRTLFFLQKGPLALDSRGSAGLSHSIQLEKTTFETPLEHPLRVEVGVSNTGTARWLRENVSGLGVVMLGTHLYDDSGRLLDLDFSRHPFSDEIGHDQTVCTTAILRFPSRGRFTVTFDLVSEGISWFENLGSEPKSIHVRVT
jgi:SAM-dependent methyltransferase